MKKAFIITLILILAACASTKRTSPSQSNINKVTSNPEKIMGDLDQGKLLFENHCGICHALKNPSKYTESEWNKIVPQMTARVNKKEGNVLDADAQQAILKYVVAMCSPNSSK